MLWSLNMKNFIVLFITTLCLTVLAGGTLAQQKTKITKAEDLPRRSVQLNGKALEILNDEAQLRRLADELLANLQNDLEKDVQKNRGCYRRKCTSSLSDNC